MLPFPRMMQYGNSANAGTAYLGMLSDSSFSYSTIQSALSPTGTMIAKQSNFRSYIFRYNGMQVILPSQPFAVASYKEIYEKGMVWGTGDTGPDIFDASSGVSLTLQNSTISIMGELYKIRLIRGSLSNVVTVLTDNPSYTNPMSEWELFVYSIWSNLPTSYISGYTINTADKIPRINYLSGSTRRWVLVPGSDGSRTSPRSIGRGRFDAGVADGDYKFSQICGTSISPLWTAAQNLWWPIFEKV